MARRLIHTFHNSDLARVAAIAAKYGMRMGPKLKAFVAKLEDVAEAYRELYVEDTAPDGAKRFKLDAEGLEDVSALKSTITGLRTDLRVAKAKSEPLAALQEGEDAEAVITAGRAELERQRTGAARDEVKNATTQMAAAHTKELTKIQTKLDGSMETLREVLIANEVRAAASDPEINGNATLLLPHIEKMATVEEYEDPASGKPKFRAIVLNAERKMRVDKDGNPLTIRGVVAELREKPEYEGAYKGSGASGSGTPADGSGGMPVSPRTPAPPKGQAAKDAKRRANDYSAI